MEFDEYLTQKKIDATAFKTNEPDKYSEWKELFEAVSPESFTAQKKFLMNPMRRRYLLSTT